MATNPALTRVVKQFSRTKNAALKAAQRKAGVKPVVATAPAKAASKAKSGMKVCRKSNKTAALRSSITPGTVLILLAGRFSGKRVVFLKQLPSGMLLVTGPFKLNGVPLKRVDQAQVIATSTKFDISSLNVQAVEESLFQKDAASKKSKKEFFEQEDAQRSVVVSEEKKNLQKQIDQQILAAVKAVPFAAAYLKSRFSLQRGQAPHSMKF
jgi:large subunit ribosomal protein L6e